MERCELTAELLDVAQRELSEDLNVLSVQRRIYRVRSTLCGRYQSLLMPVQDCQSRALLLRSEGWLAFVEHLQRFSSSL